MFITNIIFLIVSCFYCSDHTCGGGGGGTIYSNRFFCSDNFGRSIYSSWRNVSGIIKKTDQRRIQNLKDFFEFLNFRGVIEV